MSQAETKRGKILEQALNLTEGDRNKEYGDPYLNLTCFANMVDAYLNLRTNRILDLREPGLNSFNAVDGAVIMVLAKVSRVAMNQKHHDSYIDMAAYAAIAGECAP